MMNPFTILTPAEAWSALIGVATIAGVCWIIFRPHGPTKDQERAYELGYIDGGDEAPMMKFRQNHLHASYSEGYMDGMRGNNRRADAELFAKRDAGPNVEQYAKRPAPPCTCGRKLRQPASEPGK